VRVTANLRGQLSDLMHGDVNGTKAQFGSGPEHDTLVVSEKSWKHSAESPAPALRPEN
jgi:hypothetical protein